MIKRKISITTSVDTILDQYGVKDTDTILQHPDNQSLLDDIAEKGKKKVTGELSIPPDAINLPTLTENTVNTFILQPTRSILDVIILDSLGTPQPNTRYTLFVADTSIQGNTDGEGRVYEEIETFHKEGMLVLHISDDEDVLQHVEFTLRDSIEQESGFNQRLKERGFYKDIGDLPEDANLEIIYQQASVFPV